MILYDERRQPVDLGASIGRGGEAVVYRLNGQPQRLAKVYDPAPRPNYARKLTWMLEHPPVNPTSTLGHASLAWPDGLLFDSKRQLKGYCMPFIRRTAALLDVFNPRRRAEILPQFDRRYLHRVARNLAAALSALHASGYVAGDLNESNVLVTSTALVTLIDADSFQVIEDRGGQQVIHPCPVGKLEYTPPELQGKRLAEVVRFPQHDAFGLGVLIFQILMEGSHPFRAQWISTGDPPPLESRIASGAFPYTSAPSLLVLPPKNAPALDTLYPWVVELVRRCFTDGHRDPHLRPTPELWERAIAEAEKALTTCSAGHIYSGHLAECPACQRKAQVQAAPPSPVRMQEKLTPWKTPPVPPVTQSPPPAAKTPASGRQSTNIPAAASARPVSGVPSYSSVAKAQKQAAGQPASSAPANVRPAGASGAAAPPSSAAGMPAAATPAVNRNINPAVWGIAQPVKAARWLQGRSVVPASVAATQPTTVTIPAPRRAAPQPANLGRWLWRRTYRSLFVGGVNGALAGAFPGLVLGAAASLGSYDPNWPVLVGLGGAAGGWLRGLQPGQRVGQWVDHNIGWDRILQGFGTVLGTTVGIAVGVALFWAILPLVLFPFIGARLGREAGRSLWKLGRPMGWPKIWAAVAALSMGGAGWFIANLAGAGGLNNLGPYFATALSYGGVRPFLMTVLSSAFAGALGGLVAGVVSDFISGLMGLTE